MAERNEADAADPDHGIRPKHIGLPASPNHMQTPKSHQRNDSSYSRNYSVLDIYGTESPMEEDVPSPRAGHLSRVSSKDAITIPSPHSEDLGTSIRHELDKLDFHPETSNSLLRESLSVSSPISTIGFGLAKRKSFIQPLNPNNIDALLESDYDRYGFKKASNHHNISKQEYNDWFQDYSQYSLRRKKKWKLLMKANGLSVDDSSVPSRFPPKSDKVKKMIRRGIPAEWRGAAWFFYAGGNEKLNKHIGVYEQITRDTENVQNKDTEVIERDLNRTFPDNIYFNDSTAANSSGATLATNSQDSRQNETPMITSLRRVLIAFAHYQPQIGYCQSLNFLAGLLLLFMEEEKAFWMLVILTERIIPKVHSANLEGVHTDQGVLMLCIKEYVPQLWNILGKTFEGERLSEDKILTRLPPVTLVTSSWFMSVFVGILPIETVLRVWDILWYEGSKTIFRISLTICKMCLDNPDFRSSSSNGGSEIDQIELFQFMQNFPKIILDPNFLIDNCFKKIGGYGFGSLPQDEINNCREFVSKQRAKLNNKKASLATELTDEERKTLISSSGSSFNDDSTSFHDVYGFHRSIMSGVVWNKNMSNKMKKKFSKKVK